MRNEEFRYAFFEKASFLKEYFMLYGLFGYSLLITHYSLKVPEVFLCSRMK